MIFFEIIILDYSVMNCRGLYMWEYWQIFWELVNGWEEEYQNILTDTAISYQILKIICMVFVNQNEWMFNIHFPFISGIFYSILMIILYFILFHLIQPDILLMKSLTSQ